MRNGYLSFKNSVTVTIFPALFFLLNGIIVLFLKSTNSPTQLYFALPLIILAIVFFLMQRFRETLLPIFKRYLVVALFPLLFAAWHFYTFGSSMGGDAAGYFSFPMHSFFSSGHFSFSEQPFVEFGEQPLATFWLPANAEYVFVGIGYLLDLNYPQILSMMHFTSNYLIGLVIFTIILRFQKPIEAMIVFIGFVALLYGLHTVRTDFSATSIFRGFENKGFIWGFYFWASVNMLLPNEAVYTDRKFTVLCGAILAVSGFLVSGNSLFLILPVTTLFFCSAFVGQYQSTIYQTAGFVISLLLGAILFKSLETTSVYSVVTADLTYLAPESFQKQRTYFAYPFWVWATSVILAATCAIKDVRLAIKLIIFIVFSQFIQSEFSYNLFFKLSPEFTVNFWRPVTLMNPFVPILFAGSFVISQFRNQMARFASSSFVILLCVFGYKIGVMSFPERSPFEQAKARPIMSALGKLCPAQSVILTDRRFGIHMPTLQPSYRYLVGKPVFLNWQIANLPIDSEVFIQARNVRDASIYITWDSITRKFGDDPTGLKKTIEEQSPDAIILTKARLNNEIEDLFIGYDKQIYRHIVVFTKPPCSTNFANVVLDEIEAEKKRK